MNKQKYIFLIPILLILCLSPSAAQNAETDTEDSLEYQFLVLLTCPTIIQNEITAWSGKLRPDLLIEYIPYGDMDKFYTEMMNNSKLMREKVKPKDLVTVDNLISKAQEELEENIMLVTSSDEMNDLLSQWYGENLNTYF